MIDKRLVFFQTILFKDDEWKDADAGNLFRGEVFNEVRTDYDPHRDYFNRKIRNSTMNERSGALNIICG
jgi:hypothetical protein